MGVLVMGADLVAVDATCCRLMGLDAQRIAYLEMGRRKKLGRLFEAEIPQLGETIAARTKVCLRTSAGASRTSGRFQSKSLGATTFSSRTR